MSQISVATQSVRRSATGMRRVSGTLDTSASQVGCASGAAADTPAAGAYNALFHAMSSVVPAYGATADALAVALDLAAQCYEAADVLPGGRG